MSISKDKIRIAVVGIGAVGGYFGGHLAKQYENDDSVEVIFIARGQHLDKIRREGLKVIQGDNEFIAKPSLATNNPADIGKVDYVIICTKTYQLEEAARSMAPCLGPDTVILPLLNGVDATERIARLFPEAEVWNGCVYIIARLKEVGVVENSGNIQQLHFGHETITSEKLETFEDLLKDSGIEVYATQEISKIVWEKYIFISSMATATTYFDLSIGGVLSRQEEMLIELIKEVSLVARAGKIRIDPEIEKEVLKKFRTLPFEATASMHSDFQNRKSQTELDALTAYVVQTGKKLGIATPAYSKCLQSLKPKR